MEIELKLGNQISIKTNWNLNKNEVKLGDQIISTQNQTLIKTEAWTSI